MNDWLEGTIAGLDIKTTSTDPREARLTAATLLIHTPSEEPVAHSWRVASGEDVPGDRLLPAGVSLDVAVREISSFLTALWGGGTPVAVYNAPHVFTVLDRGGMRMDRFLNRTMPNLNPIIDPLVVDRAYVKDRNVKRDLGVSAMCEHYGLVLDDAEVGFGDALGVVMLARELPHRFPEFIYRCPDFGVKSLSRLYCQQRGWHSQWLLDTAQGGLKSSRLREWPAGNGLSDDSDPAQARLAQERYEEYITEPRGNDR